MSAILCLEDVMEEEQDLPNRMEIDLNVGLKMMGCRQDGEGDATVDIQMNPDDVLGPFQLPYCYC